ncbi:hypothetical protein A3A76_00505 [Candidatus Woesebacteria bacterium RIFCSPLOWO2_01_FULL_39_23]|uniref:OmpR/PhoB-type domain-containing protein n=1 Tax=Candidatus Woesebacteria bacterium RIFCSPHIGHO2_01_FULL_40_22 TaxID=1802499 RepID=A0A1F7YIS7_9BACT|nr:MAG: hypothetical protein A2141_05880 [Candidatus Woesebacteria bacterium RBG_16_40_11]OGM27177.1 MAG: hypothetical protein A2628_04020 [Candidatus Woesebacteria bacterium RIFCSPHIGHO2_01_FULL_40_22]OGM36913.1 MAG: hypothetical protein A3E41_05070 [Candidatus Woesebacteria bacterium RIFCSPHIGHO2_12_FULL_38_9]OGM63343.1 MAG: hypothetical protein A3A76_00505 [Candidatus Woesebacteria bacterium RIFCSPLOWO2_01_FULL_39_23]
MKIKTTWEYSLETEAKRVIHCAHQMVVGFYRVNNFYVLPLDLKTHSSNIVLFPDLPYHKIPRFWNKAKKVDVTTLPIKADRRIVDEVKLLLEKERLPKPNYHHIKKGWGKASNTILEKLNDLIPKAFDRIGEIIIYPTVLGTSCSFNILSEKDSIIYIWLREDRDIYSIVEAIITSITRKEAFDELHATWSESEFLSDWLVTKSALATAIAKYQKRSNYLPTLKGTRGKQNAQLLKESDEFYKKLGLPINSKVFNLNGRTPEINKKQIEDLTNTEKNILRLLIENADNVVTFDKIADYLFPDSANFSLYAISKTIQRLRDKLEENGISGSYIQTLRGRGYLLKN